MAACTGMPRSPVPMAFEKNAQVLGMSEDIRFWGDELPPDAEARIAKKWAQTKANRPGMMARGKRPVVNYLAISGGGSDGAYGAGLLGGWTATGTRPEFDVVTGVSTGALTAPFAFLGPKYDQAMKHVYTQTSTKDVAIIQPVRGLLGGSSLASNAPLARVVAHYVDEKFLREVAAEHNKGRRLLIGTTNLDAERPVVWDMGEIASSGHPEALQLFRTVLLASAAIPAVFPPGYVKVAAANGAVYDEMHVDGGTTRQVFLLPTQLTTNSPDRKHGVNPIRRAYIIRNGRVTPSYKPVKAKTLSIAGRAVSSLIKSQGVGDLYELYEFTRLNNIQYNLAVIPGDFADTSASAFDSVYMAKLYELGYNQALTGYPWKRTPPRLGQ
jgi:Patatin-like phospholipase